jgi:hypothetical protein
MTGQMIKEDIEYMDNPENLFIFNFNLLFTSGDYWERTPENRIRREEALRKLYVRTIKHYEEVKSNG